MRKDRDPVFLCNPLEWDFDALSAEKLETKHSIKDHCRDASFKTHPTNHSTNKF